MSQRTFLPLSLSTTEYWYIIRPQSILWTNETLNSVLACLWRRWWKISEHKFFFATIVFWISLEFTPFCLHCYYSGQVAFISHLGHCYYSVLSLSPPNSLQTFILLKAGSTFTRQTWLPIALRIPNPWYAYKSLLCGLCPTHQPWHLQ